MWKPLQLWKIDIDGRVFAYDVVVGLIAAPDATGKYRSIGASWEVVFYDVDGSGRFKVMKQGSHPFTFDIPRWVSDQKPAAR